ncbi:hypothetical protein [Radiobacillus sp. PE A8.2]|uniref:hypothetical protein n=1 Tax=Radiobacillus sp. PE A8.2 TaxID=3380349 RepID=UPI00388E0B2B
MDKIKSYHEETVKHNIAIRRNFVWYKHSHFFTLEEADGKYFLMNGFMFYDALQTQNKESYIPCFILDQTSSDKKDRLLKILFQGTNGEPTSWKFKWRIIKELTEEHHVSKEKIAGYLHKETKWVANYMLEDPIPDAYKKRAIETHATWQVNFICNHPAIPKRDKLDLYEQVVNEKLSNYQVYMLASYYNMSYYSIYGHPYAAYPQLHRTPFHAKNIAP